MEIIQKEGRVEGDKIYVKSEHKEFVSEFRKLKGRYYKKKDHWIFSKQAIHETIEAESKMIIEKQCSAQTCIIEKLYNQNMKTDASTQVNMEDLDHYYQYDAPAKFYEMFQEYIDSFQEKSNGHPS
jgi:hypothetical protein